MKPSVVLLGSVATWVFCACASDNPPPSPRVAALGGAAGAGGLPSQQAGDATAFGAGRATGGASGTAAQAGGGSGAGFAAAGLGGGGTADNAGTSSGGALAGSAGSDGVSGSSGGVSGAAGTSSGVSVGGAHPWVLACAPNATRQECCTHYCNCMAANCSMTAPSACVETCTAPDNHWNLKCRVEQCFEALNPSHPEDKASHCGHAIEKPPKCQGIIP